MFFKASTHGVLGAALALAATVSLTDVASALPAMPPSPAFEAIPTHEDGLIHQIKTVSDQKLR